MSGDDSIPSFLLTEITTKEKRLYNNSNGSNFPDESQRENMMHMMRSIFSDDNERMNLAHKERLASSLLLGAYHISNSTERSKSISRSSPGLTVDSSITKNMAHWKRHVHKNRFLELESSSARIHQLKPIEAVTEEKHRRSKQVGKTESKCYYWAGKYVSAGQDDVNEKEREDSSPTRRLTTPDLDSKVLSCLAEASRISKMSVS